MSAKERPDVAAFRELETLVRGLGDDLASQRKKTAQAESALKEAQNAPRGKISADRAAAIEGENAAVKSRMGRAEDRVKKMLDRVRFLRQQLQAQPGNSR